jgi:hypothetical protein
MRTPDDLGSGSTWRASKGSVLRVERKFKKRLRPGSVETWGADPRTPKPAIIAEDATTAYDALFVVQGSVRAATSPPCRQQS